MTEQTPKKIPANAEQLGGKWYVPNGKGDMVALENIKAQDLLIDEMVRSQVGYAKDLNAELARFQTYCYSETGAMDAVLDQQYGIKRSERSKGNRTYSTIDGAMEVKVAVSDQIAFGPELQSAKKLLDEMIRERSDGADPFLVTLVNQAFNVDKEGQVDRASILALSRLDVPDERWPAVQQAIADATRVVGTKNYIRFYEKNPATGKLEMVPLDMAAIAPTPDAWTRRSLRRQVEEGRDTAEALVEALLLGKTTVATEMAATLLAGLGGPDRLAEVRAALGLPQAEAAA